MKRKALKLSKEMRAAMKRGGIDVKWSAANIAWLVIWGEGHVLRICNDADDVVDYLNWDLGLKPTWEMTKPA